MGHAGGGQVHDRHRNRLGVVRTHLPFSRPEHVGGPDAERQKELLKRHRTARFYLHGFAQAKNSACITVRLRQKCLRYETSFYVPDCGVVSCGLQPDR